MDKATAPLRKMIPLIALLLAIPAQAATPDQARWRATAARVTITRDDWGIAHVRGKTDADAVFGAIYAQAEDDFARIEANYLAALGRTDREAREIVVVALIHAGHFGRLAADQRAARPTAAFGNAHG